MMMVFKNPHPLSAKSTKPSKRPNFAFCVRLAHIIRIKAQTLDCNGSPSFCNNLPRRLANAISPEPKVEGAASEFEVLQGDWVQISPYGQFPHSRGLQYFDHTDAQKIVDNFGSLRSRLARVFGGLPWFEGHPDTSPKDYPNKRAYGWIDELQARSDGLYGHVKWTKAGNELVAEGHYKYFSPVWDAAPARVAGENVLRPVELISVGFTNTPNMPVLPLANEPAQPEEPEMNPEMLKALGFADDANPSDDEVKTAFQTYAENMKKAGADEALANEKKKTSEAAVKEAESKVANERTTLETELANAKEAISNLQKQADDAGKARDAERKERIELMVASAVANGKITKAEADKWRADLQEDFAGKSVELANSKSAVKTEAVTKDLGKKQAALEQGSTPSEQALALANEKKTSQGISFDAAWRQVKTERPDLFKGMHQPKGN